MKHLNYDHALNKNILNKGHLNLFEGVYASQTSMKTQSMSNQILPIPFNLFDF